MPHIIREIDVDQFQVNTDWCQEIVNLLKIEMQRNIILKIHETKSSHIILEYWDRENLGWIINDENVYYFLTYELQVKSPCILMIKLHE